MANYETLKSSIQQVVRANGNQEITGDILQQVLLAMVNSLGDGYQFAGIATPSTNPGVPDQRVFYIAAEPGVYPNFGTGIPVVSSVVVIRYDSVWSAIDTGIPNNKGVQDVTTLIVHATDEEDIIETDLDVDAIESAIEAGKRVVLRYGTQELGFVSIGRRGPTTKVAIFANMFDATGENPYLQTFIVQDYECTVYTDSLTKMSLIGVLSHLQTEYKTDIVGAINEVSQKVTESALTNNSLFNNIIRELWYRDYTDGIKVKVFVSGDYRELQIYSSNGTTLLSQYPLKEGVTLNKNNGFGVLALGVNGFTSTTPLYELSSKIKYLDNSPILKSEYNTFYWTDYKPINDVLQEIYIENTGTYTARIFVSGTYREFQLFKSGSVYSTVPISQNNLNRVLSLTGSDGGKVKIILKSLSDATTSSSQYALDAGVNNILYSGLIYTSLGQSQLTGNASFDRVIKEIYVNTNATNITARIITFAEQYLQVFSGSTLLLQVRVVSNTIQGNAANGFVIFNDFGTTPDVSTVYLPQSVTDIKNSPLLFAYNQNVFYVKKGATGNYNSLTRAIVEATKTLNSVVYVYDGVYDLKEEFEEYYGADFFTNYDTNSPKGLLLTNGIKLIFSEQAKVKFIYNGSNTTVMSEFSPFNSRGSFEIQNLDIETKNCRYCVHDEMGGTYYGEYWHTYKNCRMLMDNRDNIGWSSRQCIGGGLGTSAIINIENCIFETKEYPSAVSYHNNNEANSESIINVTNCYFADGNTFRLSWLGASTLITTAKLCGNSFGAAIIHNTEGGTIQNTQIVEWNNIVRNPQNR